MWLDSMVLCVKMVKDRFGKTKIQLTHNLYVILRNLDILPTTKIDHEHILSIWESNLISRKNI